MKKRIIYSIAAGVVALSLVVSGVWAWIDNSQHKSNVVQGGPDKIYQDVTLIEEYEEPEDWLEGTDLTKKISAKNTGEGVNFVRIQLKEYMEVAAQHYDYALDADEKPYYMLTAEDGSFVASDGPTAADKTRFINALRADGVVFEEAQVVGPFRAYGGDGVLRYYLSGITNLNGKNGKKLLVDFSQDAYKSFVTGAVKGSYEDTEDNSDLDHRSAECNYAVHTWDGADHCDCGNGDVDQFHKYIKWNLGDDIILMSDWLASGAEATPQWILDDVSDAKAEGWAYWGQAMQPGDITSLLMESMTLIEQPNGPFYYALHVDMQAADIYQLRSNFTGMPPEIAKIYGLEVETETGVFAIDASTLTVRRSGTIRFTATWNGEPIDPTEVTWELSDGSTNVGQRTTLDQDTDIATIGPWQNLGTLIATATYDSPDGTVTESLEFTVTA